MVNADLRSAEVIKRLIGIDFPSVVEIGVYEGEMSRRLLYRTNLHLLMVDPWGQAESSEAYKATDDPMATMTKEQWDEVRRKSLKNVSFAADRVRAFQGTSEEAAEYYPDDKYDLVFIDGDHSYDATSQDIETWWDRVADGGWLGGHDYRNDKGFGVVEAVNEFAEEHGLPVELGKNYTWFIRK